MDDFQKIALSLSNRDFEETGIFELRTIARDLGVKSPTSLKKAELITKIKDIISGKEKPAERSFRGRPVKDLFIGTADLKFVGGGLSGLSSARKQSREIVFGSSSAYQDDSVPFYVLDSKCESKDVSGVLEICISGFGSLYSRNGENKEEIIFVPKNIIIENNLRYGDFIKGKACITMGGNKTVLTEVNSINSETIDSAAARKNFEELTALYPKKKFNFGKSNCSLEIRAMDIVAPIGRGQRAVISFGNNFDIASFVKKLVDAILNDSEKINIIGLFVNELPEVITEIKRIKGIDVFATEFDKDTSLHISTIGLATERAKRLIEISQDVVIIVGDTSRISRFCEKSFDSDLVYNASNVLNKIFASARNIEFGASLTVIGFASESGFEGLRYNLDDISNVCNWKIGFGEKCNNGLQIINFDKIIRAKSIFENVDISKSTKFLVGNTNEKASEVLYDLLSKTDDNDEFLTGVE